MGCQKTHIIEQNQGPTTPPSNPLKPNNPKPKNHLTTCKPFVKTCTGSYRFGFQGQEQDNEISGTGNSYTAEFWQYDPRLGRRWNVDPVDKPWEGSYTVFGNNPIKFIDPKGLTKKNPFNTGPIRRAKRQAKRWARKNNIDKSNIDFYLTKENKLLLIATKLNKSNKEAYSNTTYYANDIPEVEIITEKFDIPERSWLGKLFKKDDGIIGTIDADGKKPEEQMYTQKWDFGMGSEVETSDKVKIPTNKEWRKRDSNNKKDETTVIDYEVNETYSTGYPNYDTFTQYTVTTPNKTYLYSKKKGEDNDSTIFYEYYHKTKK